MELHVIKEDQELTHIALAGRLDLPGVQSIEKAFSEHAEGRGKPTVVDLSKVAFLGSSGIRMLLKSAKELNKLGVKMVLLKPQQQVEAALMYVEFNKLIPIQHDTEQAMQALKG